MEGVRGGTARGVSDATDGDRVVFRHLLLGFENDGGGEPVACALIVSMCAIEMCTTRFVAHTEQEVWGVHDQCVLFLTCSVRRVAQVGPDSEADGVEFSVGQDGDSACRVLRFLCDGIFIGLVVEVVEFHQAPVL